MKVRYWSNSLGLPPYERIVVHDLTTLHHEHEQEQKRCRYVSPAGLQVISIDCQPIQYLKVRERPTILTSPADGTGCPLLRNYKPALQLACPSSAALGRIRFDLGFVNDRNGLPLRGIHGFLFCCDLLIVLCRTAEFSDQLRKFFFVLDEVVEGTMLFDTSILYHHKDERQAN